MESSTHLENPDERDLHPWEWNHGTTTEYLKQKLSQCGGTQPNPQYKFLEFCPKIILSCLPEENVKRPGV